MPSEHELVSGPGRRSAFLLAMVKRSGRETALRVVGGFIAGDTRAVRRVRCLRLATDPPWQTACLGVGPKSMVPLGTSHRDWYRCVAIVDESGLPAHNLGDGTPRKSRRHRLRRLFRLTLGRQRFVLPGTRVVFHHPLHRFWGHGVSDLVLGSSKVVARSRKERGAGTATPRLMALPFWVPVSAYAYVILPTMASAFVHHITGQTCRRLPTRGRSLFS